jgi:hypothetical protein
MFVATIPMCCPLQVYEWLGFRLALYFALPREYKYEKLFTDAPLPKYYQRGGSLIDCAGLRPREIDAYPSAGKMDLSQSGEGVLFRMQASDDPLKVSLLCCCVCSRCEFMAAFFNTIKCTLAHAQDA